MQLLLLLLAAQGTMHAFAMFTCLQHKDTY
jgi:hypothetical protein